MIRASIRAMALAAVDLGNSAVKFGAFEGSRILAVERFDVRRSLAEDAIPPAHFVAAEEAVVLASSPARAAEFAAWTPRTVRVLGDDVRRAVATSYRRPQELGLDRIAAAFGARELTGAARVAVASLGTAFTVDALGRDGRFVACAIAPGLRAAAEGLRAAAPHLPFADLRAGEVRLPSDGSDASLRAGHISGFAGLVDRLLADAADAAGGVDAVVVTGGAAPSLLAHLRTPHRHEPHAVLHGIRILHARVPA